MDAVGGVPGAALWAAGFKRQHNCYTAPFKRSALEQIAREGLPDREAAAPFKSATVLSERSRKMAAALPPRPSEVSAPNERTEEELLKENEYLRAEVSRLAIPGLRRTVLRQYIFCEPSREHATWRVNLSPFSA